jgi:SAM-dependent methyltransferase
MEAKHESHKVGEYGGQDHPEAPERERLQILASDLNPETQKRMKSIGIGVGWSCLELGAAEGSMSRFLADQVGPTGRVVAADIDVRFLADIDVPNIEVRETDIRSDELEKDCFDFAYCRTILLHLPDPDSALRKLAGALKSGGLLLAEDSDMCVHSIVDPDHPDADFFEDFYRRLYSHVRATKRFDTKLGRSLPKRLREAGLIDIEFEATASYQQGAGAAAQNLSRVLPYFRDGLLEQDVASDAEIDRIAALLVDPQLEFVSGLRISVCGRKP